MIVVISCGAKKAATAQPAIDLYQGAFFRAMRSWARSVTKDRNIYIMSAKYGLLPASKVIEPYNLRMGQAGCVSVDTLQRQARALHITYEQVIIVAGKNYLDMAKQVWSDLYAPFTAMPSGVLQPGMCGMGYQLQAMKQHAGHIPQCAPVSDRTNTPDLPITRSTEQRRASK
jgi:hypothetical protein